MHLYKKMFCDMLTKTDGKRIAAQTPPVGIETICDVPYIEDGSKYHLLDVYRPEAQEGKLPLILDIHGGGWYYGFKEINKYYCMELARRGFTVVNINYRLAIDKGTTFVNQLEDVFAVFEWLKTHGDEYGYDENNMFITGDSAGGHLTALALNTLTSEELQKLFGLKCDIQFRAAGLTCGALNMDKMANGFMMKYFFDDIFGTRRYCGTALHKAAGFESYLTGDICPLFLITAYGDFIGKQTRVYPPILDKLGIEYDIIDWAEPLDKKHKLQHVFNIVQPFWEESVITNDRMCDFFKKYLVK